MPAPHRRACYARLAHRLAGAVAVALLGVSAADAQPHARPSRTANGSGLPLVRTYQPHQHGAEPQNWSIAQAPGGLMYFGNTGGLLEYDGVSWRMISIGNGSTVRSVEVCPDGRVYVGAQGDFGYLEPGETAQLRFASLKHTLPEADRTFTDVWSIACLERGAVFHATSQLMRWDGSSAKTLRPQGRFYFVHSVGGRIYVPDTEGGLFTLEGDALRPVEGGSRFVGDDLVVTMTPFGTDGVLTTTLGANAYVLRAGGWAPFPLPAPLSEASITHATSLSDGSLAFATLEHGVFVAGSDGTLLQHLDRQNGLQHGTTFHVFEDREGGLWIAENEGVTRLAWPPVLSVFDERHGLAADPSDVQRYAGTLYVASNSATVQRLDAAARDGSVYPAFRTLPGFEPGIWALHEHGGALLIAGQRQIWRLDGDRLERLVTLAQDDPRIFYELYPSPSDTSVVYVGSSHGLHTLVSRAGRWSLEKHPAGPETEVRSMAETASASLFVAYPYSGLFEIPTGGDAHGPPSARPVVVGGDTLRGTAYRLTDAGGRVYLTRTDPTPDKLPAAILRFDEATARFEPAAEMDAALLHPGRTVFRMQADRDGNLWMRTSGDAGENGVALRRPDGTYRWLPQPFALMPDETVYALHPDGDSLVWLATNAQLFRYDRRLDDTTRYGRGFTTLIRRVTLHQDSVLFGGHASGAPRAPALAAADNDLRIEFAALSYHDEGRNRYQVRLDGLDDDWSAWTAESWKDYTGLPPGRYHFRVRARNVFGVVSDEAAFGFRILPPWYQTWWAYGVYALFVLGMLVPGVRYVSTRRLQRQVRALETERRLHEERARISRDLHDNVGAQLTNILSGIELIHLSAKAGEHDRTGEFLTNLETDAHETMRQLRETIWALHQDRVSVAAFRDQLHQFVAAQTRYRERPAAHLSLEGDEAAVLSPVQALHLYRIAQEAIHNALKYAGADNLYVALRAGGGAFELEVRDDGTFLERTEAGQERRYGLDGMRRRAEEMGGRFDLKVDGGTTVSVRVALARDLSARGIPAAGD